MKKLLVIGTLAAFVAVSGLAVVGATAAFAQGPTPTSPMYGLGMGGFGGFRCGPGFDRLPAAPSTTPKTTQ